MPTSPKEDLEAITMLIVYSVNGHKEDQRQMRVSRKLWAKLSPSERETLVRDRIHTALTYAWEIA